MIAKFSALLIVTVIAGFGAESAVAGKARVEKLKDGYEIKVTPDKDSGIDAISVVKDGKNTGCVYEGDDEAAIFREATFHKLKDWPRPVLIAEWNEGVHGERAVVLDPELKDKCAVFHLDSKTEIDFKEEGDEIKFGVAQFNEQNEKTGVKTEKWKPSFKAPPLSSPSAPKNQ